MKNIVLFGFLLVTSAFCFNIMTETDTDVPVVGEISWPYYEGSKAPYSFQPINATMQSTPTKGVDNVINITGYWRGDTRECYNCFSFYFQDKLMHRNCEAYNKCYNYTMNQVTSFVE
jgi:hypothetical protein